MARKTSSPIRPIYALNGPNLNLLGTREPEVYGRTSLADIDKLVTAKAKNHGHSVVFRQTNHEGEMIDWLQEARVKAAGVILNPAGWTHTSVALLDSCRALDRPLIEVHLSNPHARESYRRHSFVSEAATGVICGFGAQSYLLAVDALATLLKDRKV